MTADTPVTIALATADDESALAALHIDSWRDAYRGLLPDEYLAERVVADRQEFWRRRMSSLDDRMIVLKATLDTALVGLACVLIEDGEMGSCLDNLHVRPDLKRLGIGRRLFAECRTRVSDARPHGSMHLW